MKPTEDQQPARLYTVITAAPYEIVSQMASVIAVQGHLAVVTEEPDGAVVIVPRRFWGPARWWAVFVALTGAPFLFHWLPDLTALQGFGIGWMVAAIVLLRRGR